MSEDSVREAIDEIWRLFRATDASIRETDARLDQRIKETDARLDQRIRETDARLDQRIKETDARLDQRIRETNARLNQVLGETAAQIRATETSLDRLEGTFGIQWGRMLEALVEPAAVQLFRERGIDVHHSCQRLKNRLNGRTMELDVVLENDRDTVVIEVKSLVRVRDVDDLLADMQEILSFFTKYDGRRVFAGIAGLEFAEEADRYAYRRGLFVLALSGENMVSILNDAQFHPMDFGTLNDN